MKITILLLSLLAGHLFYKIFDLSWILLVIMGASSLILLKTQKKWWYIWLAVLFLINLAVNKLFTVEIRPFGYSFNFEKIIITNPGNLDLIKKYWSEDLWMLYRLRNIFYSSFLVVLLWIDSVLKLLSPVFWIRILGYSGFLVTFLGIIRYFKNKVKSLAWIWYFMTIILSSALGILIDSKSAVILALPVIIYWMYLGITDKNFDKYKKWWCLLLIIDFLLK